jgi:hypothetical protein
MTNNRQFHHGAHMLVGALRKTYGPNFAKGCADNERLSEVLAKDASLRRVIRDHEAGTLERISRSWKGITPRPQDALFGSGRYRKRGVTRIPGSQSAMAVDARYRDKSGEISRKHGDTPIGTLRISYGSRFDKGCADSEKLNEVLAKLDEPSLFRLVRDHKAGMLPIRLKTFLAG